MNDEMDITIVSLQHIPRNVDFTSGLSIGSYLIKSSLVIVTPGVWKKIIILKHQDQNYGKNKS